MTVTEQNVFNIGKTVWYKSSIQHYL